MKKLFLFLTVLAAVLSCSKNQDTPETAKGLSPMTFKAIGEITKTSLAADGKGIVWSTNDKINVFSGSAFGTNTQFSVSSVESEGKTATFEGLAEVSPEYYALSPYQEGATINSAGLITAEIPAEQHATTGSFGPEANLSVAHISGSEDIEFKNAGALLSVSIEATDVTGLKVEALGGGALSGTVTINYNDGEPTVSAVSGNSYVQTEVSGAGTYYFSVLPGTFNGGFKITLSKGGYSASVSDTKSLVLGRNDNVHLFTVPSEIPWKANFTPGERVFIKGLANADENGQELSFITDSYYAPRAGGQAPSSPAPGDESAVSGITYNYEVWAKIGENDEVYFETESGARFALNVAADQVAPIASNEAGPRISVSDSPYRIRLNLPSGDAQVLRVGLVNYSILYGDVSDNLTYDKAGRWKISDYVFAYSTNQSWDPMLCRYRFSIWFNWKGGQGGSNFDVWQRYGTCTLNNNIGTKPSTENPAEEYYYLQPFNGDGWDTVFYLPDWLFNGGANRTKKGTLNLFMNNTYGHFTHGFSDIVDNN